MRKNCNWLAYRHQEKQLCLKPVSKNSLHPPPPPPPPPPRVSTRLLVKSWKPLIVVIVIFDKNLYSINANSNLLQTKTCLINLSLLTTYFDWTIFISWMIRVGNEDVTDCWGLVLDGSFLNTKLVAEWRINSKSGKWKMIHV